MDYQKAWLELKESVDKGINERKAVSGFDIEAGVSLKVFLVFQQEINSIENKMLKEAGFKSQ